MKDVGGIRCKCKGKLATSDGYLLERARVTETISGSLHVVRGRYDGHRMRCDCRVGSLLGDITTHVRDK